MRLKAKMIAAAVSVAVLCATSAKADATTTSVTNAAFIRAHFGELQIGQSRKKVLAALRLPPMDERSAMGSSFVDHEQYPLDSGETLYLYFEHDRETWRLKCAVIGTGVIHERFRTGTGMPPEVIRAIEKARRKAPHNASQPTK